MEVRHHRADVQPEECVPFRNLLLNEHRKLIEIKSSFVFSGVLYIKLLQKQQSGSPPPARTQKINNKWMK